MTRRYFKDPVIALYMMKHFDVRVNLFNSKRIPLGGNKLYRKPNVPDSEVYSEMVSYLQFCIDKNGKIYVAKESEHIFEQKENDVNLGTLFENIHNPRIIMRDNKQFFEAEVENE